MKGTIIGVISLLLLAAIMQPAAVEARPSSTLRRTLKVSGPFKRTACEYKDLKVSCSRGNIEILYAKYGGSSRNSCKLPGNPAAKPCQSDTWTDVTHGIDDKCNGKKSCELFVTCNCNPNTNTGDFGYEDNCPNMVKMGEVSWYCT